MVREFEEADLRTYRLSFAIKIQPKAGLNGSVILKKQPSGVFEILHTADFDPNSKNYISYKKRVKREQLAGHLAVLGDQYYQSSQKTGEASLKPSAVMLDTAPSVKQLYQCKHCLSMYDDAYGDVDNGISPNTLFVDIEVYCCPVCGADKNSFDLVERTEI